jgi:hypothetical protein
MRKMLGFGFGVGLVMALAGQADAFGCRSASCEPCVPMCITYVEQKVTCHRAEWKTVEYKYTVNRVVCKEVITKEKCTRLVPKYYDEKRTVHYTVQVAKPVEYEVRRCRSVCVQVVDPCTGCTYSCYRPEYYTERVKATVMECQPASKEIVVKVCRMEPVVELVDVRRVVRECVPEVRTACRRVCHMVPYETTVRVPVRVPCCPTTMPPAH